jgi:rare lipoprotein A
VESIDPGNYQMAAGNSPANTPEARQITPVAIAQPLAPLTEKIAATPAVLPATGADGSVFLQLGAFSSRENAENFSGKMKLGLGQLVEKLQIVDAGGLFRVRLGPYANRSEAGQVATQISQAANISPVIAR